MRSKGGAVEWVFWQTGTEQLLPRLLAGRTAGPVFLADRLPIRAAPALDLDPSTGRARLSYRRAAAIFAISTGWSLHQLRHSALVTHAAEDGTNKPASTWPGSAPPTSTATPSTATTGGTRRCATTEPTSRR